MARETKYGISLTEPPFRDDDEPIFILRAKDLASRATLESYRDAAFTHGATDEFVNEIQEVIVRFTDWQFANHELVKVPD